MFNKKMKFLDLQNEEDKQILRNAEDDLNTCIERIQEIIENDRKAEIIELQQLCVLCKALT